MECNTLKQNVHTTENRKSLPLNCFISILSYYCILSILTNKEQYYTSYFYEICVYKCLAFIANEHTLGKEVFCVNNGGLWKYIS